MLHDNCVTAYIVFTQTRSMHGGWATPVTTGDAYTEEADALRNAQAMISESQQAWIKRIRVHLHR